MLWRPWSDQPYGWRLERVSDPFGHYQEIGKLLKEESRLSPPREKEALRLRFLSPALRRIYGCCLSRESGST